jgi:hypothetical protein
MNESLQGFWQEEFKLSLASFSGNNGLPGTQSSQLSLLSS